MHDLHDNAFEQQLRDALAFIEQHEIAASTRDGYERAFASFSRRCDELGRCPLPTDETTLLLWLVDQLKPVIGDDGDLRLDGISGHTARLAITAINWTHLREGLQPPAPSPAVRDVIRAACRLQLAKRARPLTIEHLRLIAATPAAARHRTWQRDFDLTLAGFGGGFRSSDLRRIGHSDVTFELSQARILIPRSKTDQSGAGATVVIAAAPGSDLCPVDALRRLLALSSAGAPLLPAPRNPGSPMRQPGINAAVKRVASVVPPSPDGKVFTSHSMRRGFCSVARTQGATAVSIMSKTRMTNWTNLAAYIDAEQPKVSISALMQLILLGEEQRRDET
jgi:integrase